MFKYLNNDRGIALIMVIVLLLVVGTLVGALMASSVFNIRFSSNEVDRSKAFYAADAGIEHVYSIQDDIMEFKVVDDEKDFEEWQWFVGLKDGITDKDEYGFLNGEREKLAYGDDYAEYYVDINLNYEEILSFTSFGFFNNSEESIKIEPKIELGLFPAGKPFNFKSKFLYKEFKPYKEFDEFDGSINKDEIVKYKDNYYQAVQDIDFENDSPPDPDDNEDSDYWEPIDDNEIFGRTNDEGETVKKVYEDEIVKIVKYGDDCGDYYYRALKDMDFKNDSPPYPDPPPSDKDDEYYKSWEPIELSDLVAGNPKHEIEEEFLGEYFGFEDDWPDEDLYDDDFDVVEDEDQFKEHLTDNAIIDERLIIEFDFKMEINKIEDSYLVFKGDLDIVGFSAFEMINSVIIIEGDLDISGSPEGTITNSSFYIGGELSDLSGNPKWDNVDSQADWTTPRPGSTITLKNWRVAVGN